MSEKELRHKLLDVIVNIIYEEREREELLNELSDEWLSTGNNLNYDDGLRVSE